VSSPDGEQPLRERVEQALGAVLDPCSVFNGTRFNLVELGMVQRITAADDGRVTVRLLLDDPICLYVAEIHARVRDAVLAVSGVAEADIEFSGDEIWTMDRASEPVRATMLERREQLRQRALMRRRSAADAATPASAPLAGAGRAHTAPR